MLSFAAIITSYSDWNRSTLTYSSVFLGSMAQVVNIMILLFFWPRHLQDAHLKPYVNHQIQCLEISLSTKTLEYVLTVFTSSNPKSPKKCKHKECKSQTNPTNQDIFKKKETFVHLLSSARRLKGLAEFKG